MAVAGPPAVHAAPRCAPACGAGTRATQRWEALTLTKPWLGPRKKQPLFSSYQPMNAPGPPLEVCPMLTRSAASDRYAK